MTKRHQETYRDCDIRKRRNIIRHPQCASWWVRVQRQGEEHLASFADTDYGGMMNAFNEALEWRDDMLQKFGDPAPAEHLQSHESRRVNWRHLTRTGVQGIGFTMQQYSKKTDERAPYIIINWIDSKGRVKNTSRSIRKYGPMACLQIACDLLWGKRLREHRPGPVPHEMFAEAWPNVLKLLAEHEDERYLKPAFWNWKGELP